MQVLETELPEVLLLEPSIFRDDRGYFIEMYRNSVVNEILPKGGPFVQDNLSCSKQGVLRGLHYQVPPKAHGKLVSVVAGFVFDVAVDIRASSPTFGRWIGRELSDENGRQLWIPPGFAHGFLTLSDTAHLFYKLTGYYDPEHDRSIRWDDPDIGIEWPLEGHPFLSEKDASAVTLQAAEIFD
jgi:dTDP-4-dehydrorhamnose 3,5-epimerase